MWANVRDVLPSLRHKAQGTPTENCELEKQHAGHPRQALTQHEHGHQEGALEGEAERGGGGRESTFAHHARSGRHVNELLANGLDDAIIVLPCTNRKHRRDVRTLHEVVHNKTTH